jgi:hypothetical protein
LTFNFITTEDLKLKGEQLVAVRYLNLKIEYND